MHCFINKRTDPCFNLAMEEYLLKQSDKEYFILYRNDPCIVVGKHQNTLAEINLEYIMDKQVTIARRLSGGGAVYHDRGNLNFTFIRNGKKGKMINFRMFTQPILEVLWSLGLPARFEGKNNLTLYGRKISGNAEHVFKNRVMHHGTLLFESSLEDLTTSLRTGPSEYLDRAVQSVRSQVTNITEHLGKHMNMDDFARMILDHIMKTYREAQPYTLKPEESEAIHALEREKYSTWKWNFGYSPDYELKREIKQEGKRLNTRLLVQKGYIGRMEITGDLLDDRAAGQIIRIMTGSAHEVRRIRKKLKPVFDQTSGGSLSVDRFIRALF